MIEFEYQQNRLIGFKITGINYFFTYREIENKSINFFKMFNLKIAKIIHVKLVTKDAVYFGL